MRLLSWLLEYAPSRLTGTGACVFAEFDTESAARQVLEQAPEWLNGFVAKGVNSFPIAPSHAFEAGQALVSVTTSPLFQTLHRAL